MSSFTPRIMPPRRVLIVGAGIAGIASALAISRELTPFLPDLQISVYERNDILSTSGGAINLTPVAQRHLDQLGILAELDRMGTEGGADIDGIEMFSSRSGKSMGTIGFTDRKGNGYNGYKGRRVMRIILSVAMMAVVKRTKNVEIVFGKKLVKGEQKEDRAVLHFKDGTVAEGDLVLGCDGVHSATRTLWVDPKCPSEYTGISFVQTALSAKSIKSPIHFRGTAMNVSRHGSMLTSYCDRDREELFVAAIVEFDKELLPFYRLESGREWRTRAIIKETLGEEMRHRFGKSVFPCIREIANKDTDWMLYPVYQVPQRARWYNDRALLLGDAAHAMPPRDESAAYALDDAILFARILARYRFEPLPDVFRAYQDIRRETVDNAYKISQRMWEKNRDLGFLEGRLKEWTLPRKIRNQRGEREAAWEFDATKIDLPYPNEDLFSLKSIAKEFSVY